MDQQKTSIFFRLAPLLLVAACAVVFMPALGGDWLGDDFHLITETSCNHGVENIPAMLAQEAGRCNYRVLRHISYALDYSVWGLNPLGYHITNLVMHLLAVLLVYFSSLRLGLKRSFALFGAAIFALHPVQVDAVGYISGRRDVLMGLGYLLAFYGAIRLSESLKEPKNAQKPAKTAKPRVLWIILMLMGSVVTVATKEMGVTIAAVVALFFLLGGAKVLSDPSAATKTPWRRLWRYRWLIVALAIPSAVVFLWYGLLHPVSTVTGQLFGGTLELHLATIFSVHGRYVELILAPIRLAGDYSPSAIAIPEYIFNLPSLFGFLVIAGIIWAGISLYKRGRLRASFGLFWYLITMLPVSHIIPHHELAAEHYLYIPLAGLALVAGDLAQAFWEKIQLDPASVGDEEEASLVAAQQIARRNILIVLMLLCTGALGARTFLRGADYQNDITHAGATVKYFPQSVRGRARLGLGLLKAEGFKEAEPHLSFVLGTNFQGSARRDVLRVLGRYFVEHDDYQKSLKLLEEYRELSPGDKGTLAALSKAYFELGDLPAALKLNRELVERWPESAEYRYKLAVTAWILKEVELAQEQVNEALKLEPEDVDSLLLAANIALLERPQEARRLLTRAEAAMADNPAEERERQEILLERLFEQLSEDER